MPKVYFEKKPASSINNASKTGYPSVKTICTSHFRGKKDQFKSYYETATLKLLQGITRKALKDTGKDTFLEVSGNVSKSWQMGLMKLKGFCTSEVAAYGGRKLFPSYISDRSI